MRKKLSCIILILVLFIGTLSGCTVNKNNIEITVSTNEINLILSEGGSETDESSSIVFASLSGDSEASLLLRVENEGIVKISTSSNVEDGKVNVNAKIEAVSSGNTRIVVYSPESDKQQYINVNVYRKIQKIEFKNTNNLVIPIGTTFSFDINQKLNITPTDARKSDLIYSLTGSCGATIDSSTGFIDATKATIGVMELTISVKDNDSLKISKNVSFIKALTSDDLTVTANGLEILSPTISLVKTLNDYYYSNISFSIKSSEKCFSNFTIENKNILEVQDLGDFNYVVKAKELGKSNIVFSFNVVGVENIAPITYTLSVSVIDVPTNISVNGVDYTNSNKLMTIYNNYKNGVKGTSLRFTLLPNSVLEENSNLIVSMDVSAYNDLIFYDTYGNIIDFKTNNILKAGTQLYVRAKSGITSSQYTMNVVSQTSKVYYPTSPISSSVTFNVKEGLTSFYFVDDVVQIKNKDSIDVTISVNNENSDLTNIYNDLDNNNIVKLEMVDNNPLYYRITALNIGSQDITFYSGNGFSATLHINVFEPLSSFSLSYTASSGVVALNSYDTLGSLLTLTAAVNKSFVLNIITNDNATINNIAYSQNGTTISIDSDTNTVKVLGEGDSKLTVDITGLDENGEDKTFSKTITITGYIPISSLSLNVLSSSKKDYQTVGYFQIEKLSQLYLKASVYPSSATYSKLIMWRINGTGGSINYSSNYASNVIFTAGPLGVLSSSTLSVTAYINEFNKTYSQTCTIKVSKAETVSSIVLNNIYNKELTFDSRLGLGADANNNKYTISATAYPLTAENRNLKYLYVSSESETSPVFSVDANGVITPNRAGNAILRIGAEDSFIDSLSPTLYVDVNVTVQDGKTMATAYSITNAEQLIDIGSSEETMSLYYKIINNIDLSNYSSFKPIGADKKLAFTGYITGKVYYKALGLYVQNYISNLTIKETISQEYANNNKESRYGLFYEVGKLEKESTYYYDSALKCGTIENISILNANVDINTYNCKDNMFKVYYGGLVAYNNVGLQNIQDYEDTSKITEYECLNLNNNSIYYTNFNYYAGSEEGFIGGLVGNNNGLISNNDISLNAVSGNIFTVIDKKTSAISSELNVGGLVGINSDLGFIIGSNKKLMNGENKYVSMYEKQGEDVTIGINSYVNESNNIDNRDSVKSESSVFGGLVGTNNGEIYYEGVSNDVYGYNYVGGFVGKNKNLIKNSYCSNVVVGNKYVGGFVGENSGIISYCDSESYEDLSRTAEKAIAVTGTNYVGGFVGYCDGGLIIYSYAVSYLGSRSQTSTLINSTSEYLGDILLKQGASNGESIFVGGLVGYALNSGIYNSSSSYTININNLSNIVYAGGLVGKFESPIINNNKSPIITNDDSVNIIKSVEKSYLYDNALYNIIKNCYYKGNIISINSNKETKIENIANSDTLSPLILTSYYLPTVSGKNATIYNNGTIIYTNGEKTYIGEYGQFGNDTETYSRTDIEVSKLKDATILRDNDFNIINGDSWMIVNNGSINNGYPILKFDSLDNTGVLFGESPLNLTLSISVKDSYTNRYIKYSNNKLILFHYTSNDAMINKELQSYNTYAISDLIEVTITPQTYRTTKFVVTSSNANILEVLDNGNLNIKGEGLITLTVASKLDAKIKSSIQIYITLPITDLKLYNSMNTNSTTLTLTQDSTLMIKKGSSVSLNPKFYAYLSLFIDGKQQNVLVNCNNNLGIIYTTSNTLITNYCNFDKFAYSGTTPYYVDIPYGKNTTIVSKEKVNTPFTVSAYLSAQFIDDSSSIQNYKVMLSSSNFKSLNFTFNIDIYEGATNLEFVSYESATIKNGDAVNINLILTSDLHSDSEKDSLVVVIYNNNNEVVNNDFEIEKNDLWGTTTESIDKLSSSYIINLKGTQKIIENKNYKILFYASSDRLVSKTFDLTIIPQDILRIDAEHFTFGEVYFEGENKGLYNKDEVAQNKICPGYSGLLKISIYPSTAYYDYIEVIAPNLHLEQFVRNENETSAYPYINANDYVTYINNGIRLANISYRDNAFVTENNGRYYVQTLLSSTATENVVYPISIKAYKYDANGNSICVFTRDTLNITSEYPPGITLSYNGECSFSSSTSIDPIYLVRGKTEELIVKTVQFSNDIELPIVDENSKQYITISKVGSKYYIIIDPKTPIGQKVTITATVSKIIGGATVKKSNSLSFTVVDYLIKDIGFEGVNYNTLTGVYGKEYPLKLSVANSKIIYNETDSTIIPKITELYDNISTSLYSTWYSYKGLSSGKDAKIIDGYKNDYYSVYRQSQTSYNLVVKGNKIDDTSADQKNIIGSIRFYFNAGTSSWTFDKYTDSLQRTGDDIYALYNYCGMNGTKYYITLSKMFKLSLYNDLSDNDEIPINNANDFMNMQSGINYILMNDISLPVSFAPITTVIQKLNGNNHYVTINGIVSTNENIGLFNTIDSTSIIENLKLRVNNLVVDATTQEKVVFGLFAAENDGTITNCSVEYSTLSSSTSNNFTIYTVSLITGETYEYSSSYYKIMSQSNALYSNAGETTTDISSNKGIVVKVSLLPINDKVVDSKIGGFVGINKGYITNSRIESPNALNSYLEINSYGTIGGFVAENSGKISSSYAKNVKITNYSAIGENSLVGGFVANNNGAISTSFNEGKFNLNSSSVDIEIQSTGKLGGFVGTNSSTISDCYSNVRVASQFGTAGFVYTNSGTINNAYSTSIVQVNNIRNTPFVGVSETLEPLNTGTIENCFYLDGDYEGKLKDPATKLSTNELKTKETFSSFAYSNNDVNGIWFMPTSITNTKFGNQSFIINKPALVDANLISTGSKTIVETTITNGHTKYTYSSVDEGSLSHPYVIYTAEQFNYLILGSSSKIQETTTSGSTTKTETVTINQNSFRLAKDIQFDESALKVATSNLSFSGKFFGNNMQIKDISIVADSTQTDEIGLFKNIRGGVVKNLTILPKQVLGGNVTKVGALAGSVINSTMNNTQSEIYGITIKNDIVIQGKNAVGGLCGYARGSLIKDIYSETSENASYRNSNLPTYEILNINDNDNIDAVSYAGGIVGIVDKNVDIVNVNLSGSIKVIGEICGGAFGLIKSGSTVKKVKFILSNGQYVKSIVFGGGIAGENRGTIEFAEIHYNDNSQSLIDATRFGNINSNSNMSFFISAIDSAFKLANVGYTIGGIVGFNDGGNIYNSYSKLDVRNDNAVVVGGIAGRSTSGNIANVYTTGSLYLKYTSVQNYDKVSGNYIPVSNEIYRYIGGIVGMVSNGVAYNINNYKDSNNEISTNKLVALNTTTNKLNISNAISINNWLYSDLWNNNDNFGEVNNKINNDGLSTYVIVGGIVGALSYLDYVNANNNYFNPVIPKNNNITAQDHLCENFISTGSQINTSSQYLSNINAYFVNSYGANNSDFDDSDVVGDSRDINTESGIIYQRFGTAYDFYRITANGQYSYDSNTKTYSYSPWTRKITNDYTTKVFGMKSNIYLPLTLHNFYFKNETDYYPVLKQNANVSFSDNLSTSSLNISNLFESYDKYAKTYTIKYSYQLFNLKYLYNVIYASNNTALNGVTFKLSQDIYLGYDNWDGINNFNGNISGDGYSIYEFNCVGYGLINYDNISSSTYITRLSINDLSSSCQNFITINNSYNTNNDEYYYGGLIGKANNMTISKCYVSINAKINIISSKFGGICGKLGYDNNNIKHPSYIKDCYDNITLTQNQSLSNASDFEASGLANTLVSDSTISNSYTQLVIANSIKDGNISLLSKNGGKLTDCFAITTSDILMPTTYERCYKVSSLSGIMTYDKNNSNNNGIVYIKDFSDGFKAGISANVNDSTTWQLVLDSNNQVKSLNLRSVYVTIIPEVVLPTNSGVTYDSTNRTYTLTSGTGFNGIETIKNYINNNTIKNGGMGYIFKLGNDFTLNSDFFKQGIGTSQIPFSGIFDGNNHKITIDMSSGSASVSSGNLGLFGRINNAIIRKVTILLNNTNNIKYSGSNVYAGGLVAYASNSSINNCKVEGTINVSADNGYYLNEGLLVGYSDSCDIYANYVIGNIGNTASSTAVFGDRIGGLVGYISNQNMLVVNNIVNVNFASTTYGTNQIVGMLFGKVTSGDRTHIDYNYYVNNQPTINEVGSGLVGSVDTSNQRKIGDPKITLETYIGSVQNTLTDFYKLDGKWDIDSNNVYLFNDQVWTISRDNNSSGNDLILKANG
jgi:hypothetical protein